MKKVEPNAGRKRSRSEYVVARSFPSSALLPISVVTGRAYHHRRAYLDRSFLRGIICWIDSLLRRVLGVREFGPCAACLLRVAYKQADSRLALNDGTVVERGAAIADLHLWNEHVPPLSARGSRFVWVNRIRRQMHLSLQELAFYARTNPDLQNITAFRARVAFAGRGRGEKVAGIAARFGFERVWPDRPPCLGRRIHDFFENFWLWGLVWAYNPRSLRRRNLMRQRHELWISKTAIQERFGCSSVPGSEATIGGHRGVPVLCGRPATPPQPERSILRKGSRIERRCEAGMRTLRQIQ